MDLAEAGFHLRSDGGLETAAEGVEELAGDFGGPLLDAPTGGSEKHAAGSAVFGVDGSADEAAALEQGQNRRYGIGVGRGTLDERNLGDSLLLGDNAEGHELVGGNAELEHPGVGATVKAEIGLAKEHSEFVTGVHRKLGEW